MPHIADKPFLSVLAEQPRWDPSRGALANVGDNLAGAADRVLARNAYRDRARQMDLALRRWQEQQAVIRRQVGPTKVAALSLGGLGTAARGAGGRLAGLARRLPGEVAETARFGAGLRPEQRFFGRPGQMGVERAGATVKNTANLLFRPRIRGLDRPLVGGPAPATPPAAPLLTRARGLPRAAGRYVTDPQNIPGSSFFRSESPRPLDRTRAAVPRLMRAGSLGAAGLSLGPVIPALTTAYPHLIGYNLARELELDNRDTIGVQDRLRANAPRAVGHIAATSLGFGDQSPMSRMHADTALQSIVPTIRRDINSARRTRPLTMGLADTLRSMTPGGYLLTRGIKALGTDEQPDYEGIADWNARRYGSAIANDPEGTAASPFTGIWKDVLPPAQQLANAPATRRAILRRAGPAYRGWASANPELALTTQLAAAQLDPNDSDPVHTGPVELTPGGGDLASRWSRVMPEVEVNPQPWAEGIRTETGADEVDPRLQGWGPVIRSAQPWVSAAEGLPWGSNT